MERNRMFQELTLDQMVELASACRYGDVFLNEHERLQLSRLIITRREIVHILEDMISLTYMPPPSK